MRVLNSAPIAFLYHVLRGQPLVIARGDLLEEVLERTVQRYLDVAPLLHQSAREAYAG